LIPILYLCFLGCASLPSNEEIDNSIIGFELPKVPSEGNAMVYIVRPSQLGFAIKFNVFVDEKKAESLMGSTTGGQYIYFEIQPGNHLILSQAENLAQCNLLSEANGIYFLEQVPAMGILFARNDLQVVKDNAGRYWVKKLKVGKLTRP
jgi:hypothetical protein